MTGNQSDETRELVASHELRVGDLSTLVHVSVYRRKSDGALLAEQSHFIKTAIQYMPHSANKPYFCDEKTLIADLHATMMGFYDQAIRRGYKLSEDWLVPNTSYHQPQL